MYPITFDPNTKALEPGHGHAPWRKDSTGMRLLWFRASVWDIRTPRLEEDNDLAPAIA